jgi:hypothetical protein
MRSPTCVLRYSLRIYGLEAPGTFVRLVPRNSKYLRQLVPISSTLPAVTDNDIVSLTHYGVMGSVAVSCIIYKVRRFTCHLVSEHATEQYST